VNARRTRTTSITGSMMSTGDGRVESSVAGHGSIKKQ